MDSNETLQIKVPPQCTEKTSYFQASSLRKQVVNIAKKNCRTESNLADPLKAKHLDG